MGCSLKHLFLLRNGSKHHFQRRTFEVVAERSSRNAIDGVPNPASNCPESLHALFAAHKPGVIHRLWIRLVLTNDFGERRYIHRVAPKPFQTIIYLAQNGVFTNKQCGAVRLFLQGVCSPLLVNMKFCLSLATELIVSIPRI